MGGPSTSQNPEDSVTVRFATYFAPESGGALEDFGRRVLGRDALGASDVEQPALDGIAPGLLAELTAEPRRYGFHATLKPPIRLAEGTGYEAFRLAARRLAEAQREFAIPGLKLAAIGGENGAFLALVPDGPCPELEDLAARCVRDLDPFRALPSESELARRRARGLTPRQDELLTAWGYPYVFEQFRFHLTLTGRIADAALRERLMAGLGELGERAGILGVPVPVREVCLFVEPSPPGDFLLRERLAFGG